MVTPVTVRMNAIAVRPVAEAEVMGKAVISSSHRSPKLKDLAEVLAMIADTHHETPIRHTQTVREADEWESATEFCAALDRLVRYSAFAKFNRRLAARR